MAIVLIGTLDTKGIEFAFVRDLLNQAHTIYGDCARAPNPNTKPIAAGRISHLVPMG